MKNLFKQPASCSLLLPAAILLLFCTAVFSQQPVPAKPQAKNILIMNATAHLGNGHTIENSVIGFENGKLILVGDATMVRIDKSKYEVVINGYGKHVYPGIIAANTILGLSEIELVRSTLDFTETGTINPDVRALIAYNTDSKVIPTVRSNGVLLAQIVPQGGMISGTSSVVTLDAWNWEDAAYFPDEGVHLNWPSLIIYRRQGAEADDNQKELIEKNISRLRDFFTEAKAYAAAPAPAENLRFEAMKGLFAGTKKLYLHAGYAKEIISAVNFAKEFGVQAVIVGGRDSWMLTDFLKENKVPVILGRTHALPGREDEDTDLPYKLPFLLRQAGVPFCVSVDGYWQVRNLAFNAGTAAGYGLSKEEALMSVTLDAAKILGIDKTAGSLEEGKEATLILSSGDILNMESCNIEYAFINGRQIDLGSIQAELYRKYKERYGLK